ncbi:MAG: sigma-70 family RNA polymerase sigma factor [Acidimicrobiia bacterium]|nr:sigma-70 family RNA polymerase sigma factor [Acidimicrobiia bacterium]NDF31805.1 sigma-70 family RNA polymerase sigma factor [Acidimicrobiia bacterium]
MNTIPWERVERAQRGDRAAIEAIVREVHPLVHNVCRRTLNNDADADDATQNALINVVRNIGRFDGRSSFTTWVYRIAANAAIDESRRRRRRLHVVSDEHEMADDASLVVETQVDDADQLRSLLQQLPEEFRVAVVLRDIMDLDYEEIAEVLGVPGGTVRSRIARGRAKLAELLGNQTSGDERQNHDQKHHGQ